MARKIEVWVKDPLMPARKIQIEDKLEEYQDLVDGYIEAYALSPELLVLCNEEGRIINLRYNCRIEGCDFFGTIVLVGAQGEDFVSCPLSDEEMERYFPYLFKCECEEDN